MIVAVLLGACACDDPKVLKDTTDTRSPITYEDYLAGRARLDDMIDPQRGVWVVYRPGAMDTFIEVASATEIYERFPELQSSIDRPRCTLARGLHGLGCDRDAPLPADDCRFEERTGVTPVSRVATDLVASGLTDVQAPKQVRAVEQAIEIKAVVGGDDTVLYFGRVQGIWRLLVIDTAALSCSVG